MSALVKVVIHPAPVYWLPWPRQDVGVSLVQQVLHISERKWKANAHHDRHANDLRRRLGAMTESGV